MKPAKLTVFKSFTQAVIVIIMFIYYLTHLAPLEI